MADPERWIPDTCGCILELEPLPDGGMRAHFAYRICPAHEPLAPTRQGYGLRRVSETFEVDTVVQETPIGLLRVQRDRRIDKQIEYLSLDDLRDLPAPERMEQQRVDAPEGVERRDHVTRIRHVGFVLRPAAEQQAALDAVRDENLLKNGVERILQEVVPAAYQRDERGALTGRLQADRSFAYRWEGEDPAARRIAVTLGGFSEAERLAVRAAVGLRYGGRAVIS